MTDLRLPACDGLDILQILRRAKAPTPMIVMTAFGDRETRARVKGVGAVLLDKPFPLEALMTTVRTMLR